MATENSRWSKFSLFFSALRYAAKTFYCLEKMMMRITNGSGEKYSQHKSYRVKPYKSLFKTVKILAQFEFEKARHSCGKNHSSILANLRLLADGYQTCASHVSAEQGRVVTLRWYDLGPHHVLMISLSSCNPDQLHVSMGMLRAPKQRGFIASVEKIQSYNICAKWKIKVNSRLLTLNTGN